MKEIVEKLIKQEKTISTMESCTGGLIANEITNIENSSKVLKFSAITYSNEYKIKMGVDPNIIDKYTVYSIETAKEMSKKISDFTTSSYGVGITGKLNKKDEENDYKEDNIVFISIYEKENDKYYTYQIKVTSNTRIQNKQLVLDKVIKELNNII